MSRRGATLIELTVAACVLGLLTAALFAIYQMGASAWQKSDAQNELLGRLQTLTATLARDAERSATASVTLFPIPPGPSHAVSFLSPLDENGEFILEPASGALVWQSYVIYYWDEPAATVRRRTVALAAPSTVPRPIEETPTVPGTEPLSYYQAGGTEVCRTISDFTVTLAGNVLTVEAEGRKKRYGSERPETQRARVVVRLRNATAVP